ncbi:MAG: hypothetical protein ACFCU8_19360 [Thermosynechococcaceae cyanobacterium]
MSLPEPFDQSNQDYSIDPVSTPLDDFERQQAYGWQEQLLPVAKVLQEEDVTVLRQQLEAAHQLLQYRQALVDSLTEQLVSDQTHLAQVEQDLEEAKLQGTRQASQVDDVRAVCKDLRSQLRRQQHRIDEYKQLLKQSGQIERSDGPLAPQPGFVPLDHGSLAGATGLSKVSPWSTQEAADAMAGPLALYRKLTEMTMATAAARTQHKRIQKRADPRPPAEKNYSMPSVGHQIELPSFT